MKIKKPEIMEKTGQFPENLKRHDDQADPKGFEASGYPADDTLYSSKDDKDKDDDNDDEEHKSDWGSVDPQNDTRPHPGPSDPMDPSGPGSAV